MLPERQFIKRLRRLARNLKKPEILRGIGDDCAVLRLPPGRQLLVTTDLCIEDVHFRRAWHPAESVGHRCLARGLSDIAAMGGDPFACFLSLGLPAKLPERWVDGFLKGLLHIAQRFGVTLAGGDTSGAKKIMADIVVLGSVAARKALLRSAAREGDRIYVTGELGGASALLNRLYRGEKIRATSSNRHFYPIPRVEVGRKLRERNLAKAVIDLSDGLSVDLAHICEESGVSAVIDADAIPVSKTATLDLALHGGDDYELLFTAPAAATVPSKIAGVPITMIGKIVPKSGLPAVRIRDAAGHTKPLSPKGWQHFSRI